MSNNVICNVCGGSEFYEDAGHSYCIECQTQTQELKQLELVQKFDNTTVTRTRVRKIQKEKKLKDDLKLTSWECYNYILIGLVDELIKLGAKKQLKEVVHMLWFKYLVKFEVVRDDPNALPKLGASNWKKDAEILYGRPSKKPKLARTSLPNASTSRAITNKFKRNAIMKSYTRQNLLVEDESFTGEQTLNNLKQDETVMEIEYNTSLCEEIYKKSKVDKIDADTMNSMHLNNTNFSSKFLYGVDVLSRIKIYCLIYVGLLIVNDKIQLGDLIRFTREGHLSYNEIEHFLPKNSQKKNLNIQNWSKSGTALNHHHMRQCAFDIAKTLEVLQYISCQNLNELCERYCTELNLPAEIWRYTVNLLSKIGIKMEINKEKSSIPNYEGRVMATIIFVLKLFFCLDGETENEFSRYAKILNKRVNKDTKMFVWANWIDHINYRKIVLSQHHFPTQYLYENENFHNVGIFTDFFTSYTTQHPKECNLTTNLLNIKSMLEHLKEKQSESSNELEFNATLTPFRDYINVLCATDIPKANNYVNKVLKRNFKYHSLECLIHPFEYLNKINGEIIEIKKRGKNVNLKLTELTTIKKQEDDYKSAAKTTLLPIKVVKHDGETSSQESVISNYKLEPIDKKCTQSTYIHYRAYENYWIRATKPQTLRTKIYTNEFFEGFPESFKMVLNECARIIEQDTKYILQEFTVVEIYVCTSGILSERYADGAPPFDVLAKDARNKW